MEQQQRSYLGWPGFSSVSWCACFTVISSDVTTGHRSCWVDWVISAAYSRLLLLQMLSYAGLSTCLGHCEMAAFSFGLPLMVSRLELVC